MLFSSLLPRDNLSLFEELYVSVAAWFGIATNTLTSAKFHLFSAWNAAQCTGVVHTAVIALLITVLRPHLHLEPCHCWYQVASARKFTVHI